MNLKHFIALIFFISIAACGVKGPPTPYYKEVAEVPNPDIFPSPSPSPKSGVASDSMNLKTNRTKKTTVKSAPATKVPTLKPSPASGE